MNVSTIITEKKKNCHWWVLMVLAAYFWREGAVSIIYTFYIQCAQTLTTAFQEDIISLSLYILKEKGWGVQGNINKTTKHSNESKLRRFINKFQHMSLVRHESRPANTSLQPCLSSYIVTTSTATMIQYLSASELVTCPVDPYTALMVQPTR